MMTPETLMSTYAETAAAAEAMLQLFSRTKTPGQKQMIETVLLEAHELASSAAALAARLTNLRRSSPATWALIEEALSKADPDTTPAAAISAA